MNTRTISIEIPVSVIDEIITAWFIQMKWSYGSIDTRCTQVERIENHVGEIVCAIVLKEACKQLKLK